MSEMTIYFTQRTKDGNMAWYWLALILAGNYKMFNAENLEICSGQSGARIRCSPSEIILMSSAVYGRMTTGRCITTEDDFLGCRNNVMPIIDNRCSGKQECNLPLVDDFLNELNMLDSQCLKILTKYLQVEYSCLPVHDVCSSSKPTPLTSSDGIISSHSADTRGCGAVNSPWIISAEPGQSVIITITDFSSDNKSPNMVTCPVVYGYIREVALGIRQNICGGRDRQKIIFTSKTNVVEIQLERRESRGDRQFLLKYEVTGCPEITHPMNVWYKREGMEAVVGCKDSDKEWRLTCSGNSWKGEIGNCTDKQIPATVADFDQPQTTDTVVIMAGIIGLAVVLCVIAVVIGTVHIKKYRMHQETTRITTTYATLGKTFQACYGPVESDQFPQASMNLFSNTMDVQLMTSYPDPRASVTMQIRPNGCEDRQSIYNSIKSN